MENEAPPEHGRPITPVPEDPLRYCGLDSAEIAVLRRVLSTDRDDDRPWFNQFMESRKD